MNQVHSRSKIRILLIEPNLLVRQGIKAVLSAAPDFEINLAAAFEEAHCQGFRDHPDILLVDLAQAQASAADLLEFRQMAPTMRILLLTPSDSPAHLEAAISCGARAYILKANLSTQLVWAVRALSEAASEDAGVSQTIADLQALAKLHDHFPRVPVLTAREKETLHFLSTGRTVREIASELALSPKTVEAHKLNLMRKLNVHSRAALMEYAQEHDLLEALPVTRPIATT